MGQLQREPGLGFWAAVQGCCATCCWKKSSINTCYPYHPTSSNIHFISFCQVFIWSRLSFSWVAISVVLLVLVHDVHGRSEVALFLVCLALDRIHPHTNPQLNPGSNPLSLSLYLAMMSVLQLTVSFQNSKKISSCSLGVFLAVSWHSWFILKRFIRNSYSYFTLFVATLDLQRIWSRRSFAKPEFHRHLRIDI